MHVFVVCVLRVWLCACRCAPRIVCMRGCVWRCMSSVGMPVCRPACLSARWFVVAAAADVVDAPTADGVAFAVAAVVVVVVGVGDVVVVLVLSLLGLVPPLRLRLPGGHVRVVWLFVVGCAFAVCCRLVAVWSWLVLLLMPPPPLLLLGIVMSLLAMLA